MKQQALSKLLLETAAKIKYPNELHDAIERTLDGEAIDEDTEAKVKADLLRILAMFDDLD